MKPNVFVTYVLITAAIIFFGGGVLYFLFNADWVQIVFGFVVNYAAFSYVYYRLEKDHFKQMCFFGLALWLIFLPLYWFDGDYIVFFLSASAVFIPMIIAYIYHEKISKCRGSL